MLFFTATTVSYSDFHPKKQLSKTLAIVISFVGLVLTGIIVALALALALQAVGHAFEGLPAYKQLVDEVEQIENAYE